MNAANEEAVNAFLQKKLKFADIPNVIKKVLNSHHPQKSPNLIDILSADEKARKKSKEIIDKFRRIKR